MTITIRRKTLVALGLLVVAAVAGTAIAAWSTNATGDANAKAATASALVLSDASASTTGDLYPGGSGALKLKIANPNAFPVTITAVSANGTITSDTTGCTSANHGVTLTAQSGLSLSLAANATATVFSIAGAVQMSSAAANACQGAVFTIPVSVTAASS